MRVACLALKEDWFVATQRALTRRRCFFPKDVHIPMHCIVFFFLFFFGLSLSVHSWVVAVY